MYYNFSTTKSFHWQNDSLDWVVHVLKESVSTVWLIRISYQSINWFTTLVLFKGSDQTIEWGWSLVVCVFGGSSQITAMTEQNLSFGTAGPCPVTLRSTTEEEGRGRRGEGGIKVFYFKGSDSKSLMMFALSRTVVGGLLQQSTSAVCVCVCVTEEPSAAWH